MCIGSDTVRVSKSRLFARHVMELPRVRGPRLRSTNNYSRFLSVISSSSLETLAAYLLKMLFKSYSVSVTAADSKSAAVGYLGPCWLLFANLTPSHPTSTPSVRILVYS
jgi:hypothetical protein